MDMARDTVGIMMKYWYNVDVAYRHKALSKQWHDLLEQYSEGKARKDNHSLHNQWIREIVRE